jgi:hypothetical protein
VIKIIPYAYTEARSLSSFNIIYVSCILYRWIYGVYNSVGKLLSAMQDVFDYAKKSFFSFFVSFFYFSLSDVYFILFIFFFSFQRRLFIFIYIYKIGQASCFSFVINFLYLFRIFNVFPPSVLPDDWFTALLWACYRYPCYINIVAYRSMFYVTCQYFFTQSSSSFFL